MSTHALAWSGLGLSLLAAAGAVTCLVLLRRLRRAPADVTQPERPLTYEDIHELCSRYLRGGITADEYFGACDRYARQMVEAEVAEAGRRRP